MILSIMADQFRAFSGLQKSGGVGDCKPYTLYRRSVSVAEPKTNRTEEDVDDFLSSIESERRRGGVTF